MNLICLIKGHNWAFGYNHGMPHHISTSEALDLLHSGAVYEVHMCSRCPAQSRMLNGKRIMLKKEEYERP